MKIEFNDIGFDREVYSYCLNDKYKCPNYNHSYSCPPAAVLLRERVSQFKVFTTKLKSNLILILEIKVFYYKKTIYSLDY